MLSLTAVCTVCRQQYGVFTGPMSSLKTKSLLESLATVEDLHHECLRQDVNLRHLYPNHPAFAS